MSLFGTLNTAVSGMAAQANKLGTISDNIANASTTGYKRSTVDFQTMLGNETPGSYTSGGVQSKVRYGITDQGTLASTTSVTDLAIKGNGFFVVQDTNGSTALTRAGSFVPNAAGDLVNTAGYQLMGYNLTDGSSATVNGTGGLQVINLSKQQLTASPSKSGILQFNVSSNATPVAAANMPSNNPATATTTATNDGSAKTSLVVYDNLGDAVTLDVYLTKAVDTAGSGTNAWEATIYNKAAANGTGGYTSGPMATQTLDYNAATGKLSTVDGKPTPLNLTAAIPNGQTLNLDISQSTQLASSFTVGTATVDGSAPSKLDHVTIGTDGTVTSVYANGVQQATYRIPLADVASPDNLTSLTGNVYQPSLGSGNMTIGAAQTGSLGEIDSDNLENSTVDLATELTSMISAQRGYEANSKVIQTSSDLLTVIDHLNI